MCRESSSSEPAVLGRAHFASCTGEIHDTARSAPHVRLYPAVSCIFGLSEVKVSERSIKWQKSLVPITSKSMAPTKKI